MPNKVILDLDPGGDDSVALLFACKCDEIKVEGVTIVVGNETVKQGTENALKVLEHIGAEDEVPVAPGCEEPLIRSHIPLKFHGPRGMGTISEELPEPETEPLDQHAINFIVDKAHELDEVTLVPTGPLTNIAMALKRDPSIKESIKEICLMGGGFRGGNISTTAEYNILQDPEAAKIVFESGIPLKIAPIDATNKVPTKGLLPKIEGADDKAAKLAHDIIKGEWKWVMSEWKATPKSHDSLAVYLATGRREAVETKEAVVDVSIRDLLTYGQTVAEFRKTGEDYRRFGGMSIGKHPWAGVMINKDKLKDPRTRVEELIKTVWDNKGIRYLPGNMPVEKNAEICMDAHPDKFNEFVAQALLS